MIFRPSVNHFCVYVHSKNIIKQIDKPKIYYNNYTDKNCLIMPIQNIFLPKNYKTSKYPRMNKNSCIQFL